MMQDTLYQTIENYFQATNIKFYERTEVVDVSFPSIKIHLPNYDDLRHFLSSFSSRDIITITFDPDGTKQISLSNVDNLDSKALYQELFESVYDDEDEIEISLRINKKINDNRLSVYNYSSFSEWLLNLEIKGIMQEFSHVLEGRTNIIFQLYDKTDVFLSTPTISFTSIESQIMNPDINRLEKYQIIHTIINFRDTVNIALIPDDFHIRSYNPENAFKKIFERIEMYLSMISISSYSYIDQKILHLQIGGHLNKDFIYPLDKDENNNTELYKIYSWAYTDGNPIDKVIIARNIISLHCRSTELISIDSKTFSSILSNYALYQKENVTQYLELKNKFAEFITNMSNKFGELVTDLSGNLVKNLCAVFTFVLVVVLTNLVSMSDNGNLFSDGIIILLYLIALGSTAYLIISVLEMNYRIKIIQNNYKQLKESYGNILDKTDLITIFQDDKVMNEAIQNVMKHRNIIIGIWGVLLILYVILISLQNPSVILSILNYFVSI